MFLMPCYNIRVKKLKKTSRRRLARLAFFAISAILLTIFLEYRYYIHVWEYTWRFVFGSPLAFLFNAYLMMLALYVIWACVRRPAATVGLMWTFLTILTYVHINKYNSRGTPILPEDFQLASQASALSKFVDMGSVVRMVLAIALAWILFLLLDRIVQRQSEKWFGRETVRRRLLAERAVTLVIATLLLICSTDFARHTDGQRYTPNFLGTHFTAWNQNRNYSDNGFILGFLYNLQKLQLSEPAGYSEEMISEAKTRYAAIADAENRERVSAADEDVSFVIVLNESLFDPTVEFQGLKFQEYYPHSGGDIMPNLHNLERKYPHGLMYSLDYGGGTANIEFETLTGMTNYWVNTVPYTSLIPRAGEIPSIARTFVEKGYATTAIHPYNSGMYKRNIALANEGFQGFISEIEMKHQEHDGNSEYINDASAYAETFDLLESTPKNQVVALITMQNHTPYPPDIYEETQFEITSDAVDDEHKASIATYYQSLHTSDVALGKFIKQLDQLDKKVVMLFFGDHSAGLFDLTNHNEDKKVRDLSRVTPYLIYANFDYRFESNSLPTTTPNCMVNTLFNTFNYQKAPLYYLLDDVCTTAPILAETYLDGSAPPATKTLKYYELITYDLLSGKKYWMND